ncbi:hypothetical protein V8C86DRAFT_2994353 [Haematococcus lacustris]
MTHSPAVCACVCVCVCVCLSRWVLCQGLPPVLGMQGVWPAPGQWGSGRGQHQRLQPRVRLQQSAQQLVSQQEQGAWAKCRSYKPCCHPGRCGVALQQGHWALPAACSTTAARAAAQGWPEKPWEESVLQGQGQQC